MNSYTQVVSIVDADNVVELRQLAEDTGIEGATGLWSVPLWEESANPETDQPVAYMCVGWMHNDLIELLPESMVEYAQT